jgi:NADH-quinone oxidoreductase subunit E
VSDVTAEALNALLENYTGVPSELIPILQDVQDVFSYVPEQAMKRVAQFLNVADSAVYGVVTFYAQFYLTPQGKHKIKVCQGTACHVHVADEILKAIEGELGVSAGESTADGEFTLERVACFGSCALAPVVVLNDKVYGNVTPDQAVTLLKGVK